MLEDGDQYVREYRAPPYPTEEVYAAERVEYEPPRGGAKAKAPAHVRAASACRLSVAPPCVHASVSETGASPRDFPTGILGHACQSRGWTERPPLRGITGLY